jgi:ankyrin repeat protein
MKIRELHREILIVKRREEEEAATATLGATAGVTTTATPVAAARPLVEKEEEEMVAAGATTGTSSDLVLNQEDWDSDADDGGDGEWVKGKWVGKVKKKSRWWEKVQEGGVKSEEGGGGGGGEKEEKQQVSGYRKKRNRDIVRISEVLSQLEQSNSSHNDHENPSADHSSSQQIISTDPSSSSSSSSSQQQQQQQQHHTIPSFTLDLPFVDCMILLMSAVDAMLTDLTAISSLNLEVKQLKLLYDEKKSLKDYSKQKYETINSKYSMFQNEINLLMKKVSSNSQRIKTFKEKLRITRLLNHVTSSGHTVISWAACHGCYEMVELLLSKGATVGYNEELLHLSATVIQITFQIFYYHSNYFKQKKLKYRQELVAQATAAATSSGMGMGRTTARGGGGGGGAGAGEGGGGGGDSSPTPPLSAAELMNLEENQNTTLGHGVEELFHLKEQRSLLIFRINRLRRNFRFPVPEAAYCGHSDIIQRIHERKLLHFNFIDSWVYPSPPPPRIRQHFRLDLDSKKIPFLQILKDSKTHFSAGILTTHEGWLPRLSSQDPYLESSQELHLLYTNLRQHISSYRHHRHIVHMLHLNKLSQILHQQKMAFAIRTSNFKECVRLSCQEDLCSIDYEIPGEGLTALIVAAEENISGLHHQYLLNDDQQPVLAVCYLLDRLERAPGINIETSTGNTALLHACALGREHVVEALLDRYANINQQNCYGHAALHVAAMNGSIRCTKLLLERGARSDMKDHNGKTPYDLALEHGFSGILTILGQYRGGYYGEITGKRGTINETIGCPSGCGVILHRHEIKDHLIECPLRTITCPLHCSDPHLIARDIQSHLTNDCPHRLLECSKCHQMIQSSLLDQHHQKKCPHRLIKCSLGCDSLIEAKELVDHQKTCLYKLIPCPELCGETYPMIKRLIHMRSECIHRRVCCPNQCSHLITFHTLTQHLHSTCPRRLLKCQWCHENIEAQSHIQHELHCSYRLMECENHCGEKIQLIQMSEHLQSSCVYRFIQCTNPNGSCEYKIREIDMFNHLNNECPNRIIFCPLGCMSRVSYSGIAEEPTRLVAKQLPLHLKTECLERLIHCGLCSLEMKAKDLPYHGRNLCEYRSCSCRNHGCCKVLRGQKLREKHERNECKYRFVLCPTGCGVAVIAKRLQLHLKSEGCPMRYVPCVLGCGLEIRQGQMGMHLQYECNKRQLQGTYGSRAGMPFRNQTSPSSPHRRNGGDTSHSNSGISRNDSGKSNNSGSGNGIGAGGRGAGRVSSPGKSVSGRKDVLQLSTSSSLDSDSPISSSPSQSPATGAAKRSTRAREGTGGVIPSNLQLSLDNDHPLQSSSSSRRTMHDSAEGKKKPKKTDSLRSLPPI